MKRDRVTDTVEASGGGANHSPSCHQMGVPLGTNFERHKQSVGVRKDLLRASSHLQIFFQDPMDPISS